jgi:hypothetical protein
MVKTSWKEFRYRERKNNFIKIGGLMQSIEIQFNKDIIDKVKSYSFQVDQLGSILFVLFALYEGKIELLDEFDDSNKQKRALFLYKELELRDLLTSSKEEDNIIYVLTEKGINLIEFIKGQSDEVTAEDIAVSGVDQLKAKIKTDNVDSWINEWLDLFPRGVKTNGKPVRSNAKECARKMEWFLKEYDYDKDTIMEATRAYTESKRQVGYEFMRCATYFIFRVESSIKDKTSDLAAWCDQIIHNKQSPSTEDTFEVLA